jgi:large subunit ribosomal protein L22
MTGPKTNETPVRARKGGGRGPADVQVRARAKFVRTGAWKIRVVLDLIRGHSVGEAVDILRFCERDAAITIGKVLRSAIANAGHNDDIPPEELYVSACFADEGPTIKRFRPRARGRAGRINKRTAHITIVVSRLPDNLLGAARSKSAAVTADRARRTAGSRAGAEQAVVAARREASGTTETVAGAVMASASDDVVGVDSENLVDPENLAATTAGELAAEASEATETFTVSAPLFDRPAGDVDALNQIVGIGPKLAEQLNELGITKFSQLAEMTDADIERLDAAVPRSAEQIGDWRTQAQEILAGTWDRDTKNNT